MQRHRDTIPGYNSERAAQNSPWGRVGDPRDAGLLAAFLCSDGAFYITGQIIGLDGGASTRQAGTPLPLKAKENQP